VNSEGNLEGARSPNLETVKTGRMLPTPSERLWTGRIIQDGGSKLPNRALSGTWTQRLGIPGKIANPDGPPMYLNPSFVEEMMGYPIGWTDLSN
jgi:hypothetical protein